MVDQLDIGELNMKNYDEAVKLLKSGKRVECHSKLHSARFELWDEVVLNKNGMVAWKVNGFHLCCAPEDYVFRLKKVEPDVAAAVNLILDCGQTDVAHHKTWVIDQVLRALTGDEYQDVINKHCDNGEYDWDEGVAP